MTIDMTDIKKSTNIWLRENTRTGTIAEMAWVDIETTGLVVGTDEILEVGILITDRHGFVVPGGVGAWTLDKTGTTLNMNDYVRNMHEESGLLAELRDPLVPVKRGVFQKEALFLMDNFFGTKRPPMSGSSVHFDHGFLGHEFPKLAELFHYRNIDNSSTKELMKLHYPDLVMDLEKNVPMKAHRVLPDLIDTIEEYRFYVSEFLWTVENSRGLNVTFPKPEEQA